MHTIAIRQLPNRSQISYELPDGQKISIAIQQEGEQYGIYVNWDHPVRVGSFRDSHTHLFSAMLDPVTRTTSPTTLTKNDAPR